MWQRKSTATQKQSKACSKEKKIKHNRRRDDTIGIQEVQYTTLHNTNKLGSVVSSSRRLQNDRTFPNRFFSKRGFQFGVMHVSTSLSTSSSFLFHICFFSLFLLYHFIYVDPGCGIRKAVFMRFV
jgi:hypothetical protein